ncbi:hypothetical protein RRSWK_07230 [Rhodopirellula sp. SWK7]|nr:hypothetical protein RRSWK_07230 [Rhodopirellula sp. SWK7]
MVFTLVAAVVVGESLGVLRSIASVTFPLVPTRDHLGSLATGLRIGTIVRNSESLASFTAVT